MGFTVDELSVIQIYAVEGGMSRDGIVATIRESLPFAENEEINKLMSSVIRKAEAMDNEGFAKIDLSEALIEPTKV